MSIQSVNYGAVQTAYVSYVSYNLTEDNMNLVTFWPTPYTTSQDVLAATTNIVVGDFTGCSVTLPNANEVSLGMNVFISGDVSNNTDFSVKDNLGNPLISSVSSATTYWIQLIRYTPYTSAGSWKVIQMGAGTSSADAASLNGLGLITGNNMLPIGDQTKLNTYIPTSNQSSAYTVQSSDQSSLILLSGGTYDVTIPSLFNGFCVSFSNTTEGVVTLVPESPSSKINNDTSLPLYPTQTTTIISDGTNLWSLGLGQTATSVNVVADVQITPSIISAGGFNLNAQQVSANVIQLYTVTPTTISNDITIFFGTFSNTWTVSNFCTPAISNPGTVYIQLGSLGSPQGDPIAIPYGENLSIYSAVSPTTSNIQFYTTPSSIVFGSGSVSTPAISFKTDQTSGLYLKSQYVPTMASHGVDVLQFDGTNTSNPILLASPGSITNPTYSFIGAPNFGMGYSSSGSGTLRFYTNSGSPKVSISSTQTSFLNLINLLLLSNGEPDIVGIGNGNSGMGIGIEDSTNQIQFYSSSSGPTYGKIASLLDTSNTTTKFSLFEQSDATATGYMKISGTGGSQVLALGTTSDQVTMQPGSVTIANNLVLNGGFDSTPTVGSMCYFDGTKWVNLPPGTAGQVLTMPMTGPLIPTWT